MRLHIEIIILSSTCLYIAASALWIRFTVQVASGGNAQIQQKNLLAQTKHLGVTGTLDSEPGVGGGRKGLWCFVQSPVAPVCAQPSPTM